MNAGTDTLWLDSLADRLGPQGLWRPGRAPSEAQWHAHMQDWRGRYEGQACAIARPATVDDVSWVVRACAAQGVSIVPQGGNTGLVGGGTPDPTGRQLLLSLQRLDRIRALDADNLSLTLEAGCTLARAQAAAADAGLLFPLSLASEGSCTIGGNLATNAGGTQVLRYGTARELCLGLEVVTADGSCWSGLSGLRKNNTGYDLRDLFIGSEGTLGIITAATVRLYPQPTGRATALVSCASLNDAMALLNRCRRRLDSGLTGFEVMAALPLALLGHHRPADASPLAPLREPGRDSTLPPWVVLIEHLSPHSQLQADSDLEQVLADALGAGEVGQAALAHTAQQRAAFWRVRESVPLAEKAEGWMVKHDIAVPTSAIPAFTERTGALISDHHPGARVVCFGHLGDGNLHYNVQPPDGHRDGDALLAFERAINGLVFDQVQAFGGTISAEHGIGQLRRDELARRGDPTGLALMRAIRQALDPHGVFNPGRVI